MKPVLLAADDDLTVLGAVERGSQLVGLKGESRFEGAIVRCDGSETPLEMPAAAMFVFIGVAPRSDLGAGVVEIRRVR